METTTEFLYWITRLDDICTLLGAIILVTAVIAIAFIITILICNDLQLNTSRCEEYNRKWTKRALKIAIPNLILSIILSIAIVFIPSTNQAMVIYGVGGTIDYLKQNDTAKQLPDKALKALDSWVESVTIENTSDTTKTK